MGREHKPWYLYILSRFNWYSDLYLLCNVINIIHIKKLNLQFLLGILTSESMYICIGVFIHLGRQHFYVWVWLVWLCQCEFVGLRNHWLNPNTIVNHRWRNEKNMRGNVLKRGIEKNACCRPSFVSTDFEKLKCWCWNLWQQKVYGFTSIPVKRCSTFILNSYSYYSNQSRYCWFSPVDL